MPDSTLSIPCYKLLAIRWRRHFCLPVETHLDPVFSKSTKRRHECRRSSLRGCATSLDDTHNTAVLGKPVQRNEMQNYDFFFLVVGFGLREPT